MAGFFDGESVSGDVFFLDSGEPGSLQRITQTPGVDDTPVVWRGL